MMQVILEEDHKLGEVEVQVHHVLKQPSTSLFQYNLNRFMPTYHIGYLLMHFHSILFEMMVPLMLEEEDHQLGGGGIEAEEEMLQGLLLCSMCRNNHCLGYVITSEWFVVYVWPGHDLGMSCLYFGVLSCDRDMRNLMWLLSTLTLWCKYYAYILSGSLFMYCHLILCIYYAYILSANIMIIYYLQS